MEYRLLNNGTEVFTGTFDELIDYLDKGGEKVYDEIVDPYLNDTDWGEAQSLVGMAINRIEALSGASVDTGADGLTGYERARVAGARGGKISRRGPARPITTSTHESSTGESEPGNNTGN